jgi:beta-lactamase regulating signal transducer with metallopeptidase domain
VLETVLTVALTNAVVALALAAVALIVGRVVRRPALTHGLWLLALLKMVTPPLFPLSVSWPETSLPPETVGVATPVVTNEEIVIRVGEAEPDPPPVEPLPAAAAVADLPEDPVPVTSGDSLSILDWPVIIGSVWIAGSLGWVLLAFCRIRRMNRLLRFDTLAPASLVEEVRNLAERLGLRRIPDVWLIPGKVSPMVWSLGGSPRLLLPVELLDGLTAEQRAAILLHELAHLHRRDHWVRWLELLATALYWWNPVVWWARHELRRAEEECCDAWVVWALPGAGRAYADALLECLDFLSDVPRSLPLGASGAGHIDLKRRLKMIMSGTSPHRLGWGGSVFLLGLAAMLLPLLPTWAQETREAPPDDRKAGAKELDKARAEVEKLRAELEEQAKKLKAAEDRLRTAATRLHKLEGNTGDVRVIIIRGEQRGGNDTGGRAVWGWRNDGIAPVPAPPGDPRFAPPGGPGHPPGTTAHVRPGTGTGENRTPGTGSGSPPAGNDQRIQDLERKLDNVMRVLEDMRRQMQGGRPGGGAGPMGPSGSGGGAVGPIRPEPRPREQDNQSNSFRPSNSNRVDPSATPKQ